MFVGFDADTAWFTGNNVPAISIQAACLDQVDGNVDPGTFILIYTISYIHDS